MIAPLFAFCSANRFASEIRNQLEVVSDQPGQTIRDRNKIGPGDRLKNPRWRSSAASALARRQKTIWCSNRLPCAADKPAQAMLACQMEQLRDEATK